MSSRNVEEGTMQKRTLKALVEEENLDYFLTTEQERQLILNGVDELVNRRGNMGLHCCNIKMPIPLYLEFKREIRRLRENVPADRQSQYTMTAFVNSAVENVIIPLLKARSPHKDED